MLLGFLRKISRALWGDLTTDELKKFGILAAIITLILGNYWMTRVMKDGVLKDLVGVEYIPYAKIVSLIAMLFIVSIFSKLVDKFEKHKLFTVLGITYACLFSIMGFALAYPGYFSLSETSSLFPYFSWIPGKVIGWFSYITIESSSLLIILFWAFVASVTKPESAKKGYPLIVTCIQIGTISFTALVSMFVELVGLPVLMACASIPVLIVPFIVNYYMKAIPQEKVADKKKKEKTGFTEGIKLIFTKPYVIGILIVSTVYEIIATILEFQMKMTANLVYTSRDAFTAFNANYGLGVNLLALVFALLGTSFIMRKLGLRFCLILYPVIVGGAVISLFLFNQAGATSVQLMWAFFASMIAVKGFSYALNNPTKEVMYIPTSTDIKFKAKSWIESFGGRSSKGIGSSINATFAESLPQLLIFGSIISFGIVAVWIVVAWVLGTQYNKLQESKQIVE